MHSAAKAAGHSIHPMLIVFPLGLLATAAIFDVVYLATGNLQWTTLSFWMIAAGVIGGLVAAVPGLIDWLAIPSDTRAKSVGLIHGVGNVVVVLLFIGSWITRRGSGSGFNMAGPPNMLALVLSFSGVVLALVTGWLGGELIERLSVGVHDGAHLDAPSSLSTDDARGPSRGV